MPLCISISPTAQDPAMIATSLRSMPRLITINPMPSPRIPRIEMLRARLSKFPTLAKPDSVKLKTMRRAMVMSRTICSCDGFVGSQRTQEIGARGAELISLDMVATGNRGGMRQLQGGWSSSDFCHGQYSLPGHASKHALCRSWSDHSTLSSRHTGIGAVVLKIKSRSAVLAHWVEDGVAPAQRVATPPRCDKRVDAGQPRLTPSSAAAMARCRSSPSTPTPRKR